MFLAYTAAASTRTGPTLLVRSSGFPGPALIVIGAGATLLATLRYHAIVGSSMRPFYPSMAPHVDQNW
jgi:hypothetical protein